MPETVTPEARPTLQNPDILGAHEGLNLECV